ncbi:uncharacterized protein PAC_16976 [Phialocephala subalpina]|uniref:Zn(2)-C6 fungal-type domain-containing protein n=1 Tax=Phialocephala subalpina TaxID=576137 RepID=A0A1L7XQ65_9HELO|nr:uncharacterized protein PAC_16976 [Phialocephala subalpina]
MESSQFRRQTQRGDQEQRQPPPPVRQLADQYPASSRPFKRPRLKLACQICRDRKIRCDGARPVCDSCSRKKYISSQCVYPGHEVEQAESYVISLEQRVRELESRELNDQIPRPHSALAPIIPPPAPRRSSSTAQLPPPSTSAVFMQSSREGSFMPRGWQTLKSPSGQGFSPAANSPPASGHNRVAWDHRSNSCDPGTASQNDNADDNTPSFLGTSSAVGFMKEVYGVFEADRQDASTVSRDTPGSVETLFPATSLWFNDRGAEDDDVQPSMQELLLPPRRTADELLHSYFNVVHPEMPVFYKPSFLQRYERLWTGSPPPPDGQERTFGTDRKLTRSDLLFHCMLDIIFALGHVVRSLKSHSSSKSTQQIFIKRASRILTLDLIGKPSLRLVHTLILMARYYQHEGLSNRNWIIVGMLIRVAQGLGLHLDLPGESQAQKEERRRTWCACTTLDSMTFGRPLMLSSQTHPPLPQVINDQYLSTDPQGPDGVQPDDARSELAFFVCAMKLSQISGKILRTFYNASTESEPGDQGLKAYSSVLELDALVQNYCDELPSYLQYHQKNLESDGFFARQASWLQIRILQTRMTVFRGAIVRLATNPLSRNHTSLTSLQRHFTLGCIDGCASASRELIDLVHENVIRSGRPDFVPPGWYTTLLMYTAGTVLVVILRAPSLRNTLTAEKQQELLSSWGTCIANLEHYHRTGVAAAAKCIATLRKIYDDGEVERQQRSGNDPNSARRANANTGSGETSEQADAANQTMGENQSWDLAGPEMPEFWWANGDTEWLNNLADFGQFAEGNACNTFMVL